MTRHTSATIARVRELHTAGWGPSEIARVMHGQGTTLALSTIRYWLSDEEREARLERDRIAKRERRAAVRAGRIGSSRFTPELKAARIQALRDAGLSVAAIAKVMHFDFGDELTAHQVRYQLDRRAA